MAELIALEDLGLGTTEEAASGLEEETSFNTPISEGGLARQYERRYVEEGIEDDEIQDRLYRRAYQRVGYNPVQVERLVRDNDAVRTAIRNYGFSPERYELLSIYDPSQIPQGLIDEIEELKEYQDQTIPKSVEAEGILKPPKAVTFEEINAEGYRSNFRRSRNFSNASSRESVTSFRSDFAPKGAVRDALGGPAIEDLFYTDYGAVKTGQGIDQLFSEIKNIYGTRRAGIEVNRHGKQVVRNRRVLGIVLSGESRDDLIAQNKIPSYYSTSNIRRLLRDGVMPFGWNAEMAVQQGFGDEISKIELKSKTKEQSNEFLHRESVKAHLKATEGDLKNLRNRLKARKLAQYYSQF